MSSLRRLGRALDDLCQPLIQRNTVAYKPLQRASRWLLACIYFVGTAIHLYVVAASVGSMATKDEYSDMLLAERSLMLSEGCVGSCCCLLALAALRWESHRILAWCNGFMSIVATFLLAVSVYFLLLPVIWTPIDQWTYMHPGTRKLLQDMYECCGFYAYDDHFAVHPCPTTASAGCSSHFVTETLSRGFALVGVGLGCSLLAMLLLAAILQRAFRLKHDYLRLNAADAVPAAY